jgi:hypothetical protein
MTDEERRQKLCAELRNADLPDQPMCDEAANEIERLASELQLEESEGEHYLRLAFIDAGANPAMTWKQEAAQIADSFGDRHEEFEPGDAIRARAAERNGK